MTPEFVRCEFCKTEVPTETCSFAAYRTKIDGKEYLFCCAGCAQRYEKEKKKKKKTK